MVSNFIEELKETKNIGYSMKYALVINYDKLAPCNIVNNILHAIYYAYLLYGENAHNNSLPIHYTYIK